MAVFEFLLPFSGSVILQGGMYIPYSTSSLPVIPEAVPSPCPHGSAVVSNWHVHLSEFLAQCL